MRCSQVRRLSSRYLERELDPDRASAVRGHLRDCEPCRHALADEVMVADAARSIEEPPEPPAGWDSLWSGIQDRVAQEEREDAARSGWSLWWRGQRERVVMGMAAVAAAGAVLALAPRFSEPADDSAPSAAATTHGRPVPEPFLDRAERQIVEADRRYAMAVDQLRALVADERAHWPAGQAAVIDAMLAELDARIAQVRGRLAVMGVPEPHARDELYAIYREQIALLQRAAVGAPIAAVELGPASQVLAR